MSSEGTMDGVSPDRNAVYQSKISDKVNTKIWQTPKLFEINYANNMFTNSEGISEIASLGFSDPIISNEIIYYRLYNAPKNSFIAAMDAKNGNMIWAYRSKEQLSNPVLAGENIFFISEDNNIYAFDAKSGKENWRFSEKNIKWDIFGLSTLVVDNTLYASTLNGKLYAVDINARKTKWIFDAKGRLSPIAASKDNLFFGDEKGNIYSLDKQGKQIWTYKVKGGTRTVLFANDSVFFRTDDGELYSLNASDGKLNWNVKIGGKYRPVFPIASVQVGSALSFFNQTIFFTGKEKKDDSLIAVDVKDGRTKWILKIDEPARNPILSNGIIYLGSLGKLYAVDSEKGSVLWSNEYKGEIDGNKFKSVVSSPAISGDRLFFITDDGIIYSYK